MASPGEPAGGLPKGPGLKLDKVVLLGRTLDEYLRFFGLQTEDLAGRAILDVASGVSSFCAEANARGWNVTAFDRIYHWPPDQIARQSAEDLPLVVRDIGAAGTYRWGFYETPERMGEFRARAREAFLADYRRDQSQAPRRYLAGELPRLPFADGQFDLVLVSYLLLVYEEHFSYEFHRDSLQELARVCRGEIRIYPTVTFEARPSQHLQRLRQEPALRHLELQEMETDFEFLAGSNRFLSVRHRANPTPAK